VSEEPRGRGEGPLLSSKVVEQLPNYAGSRDKDRKVSGDIANDPFRPRKGRGKPGARWGEEKKVGGLICALWTLQGRGKAQ